MLTPRQHNFVSYFGALLVMVATSSDSGVGYCLWVLHFARRTLETVLLFDFSAASVPAADSAQEFAYYWVFGAWVSWALRLQEAGGSEIRVGVGVVLWAVMEVCNCVCHWTLAKLANKKERDSFGRRPFIAAEKPLLFSHVTCPHYLFEIASWVGFNIATHNTLPGLLFMTVGATIMSCWAVQRHEQYRSAHGATYPAHRTPLVPGLDVRPPQLLVEALAR
eukprot:SAG31_NODE_3471_length_4234_cov_2.458525_1_plen_221_part_00